MKFTEIQSPEELLNHPLSFERELVEEYPVEKVMKGQKEQEFGEFPKHYLLREFDTEDYVALIEMQRGEPDREDFPMDYNTVYGVTEDGQLHLWGRDDDFMVPSEDQYSPSTDQPVIKDLDDQVDAPTTEYLEEALESYRAE